VSQQQSRRAAFGAAVLGVLLALSAGLGIALAPGASTAPSASTSAVAHDTAISAASWHGSQSLRAVHPAAFRTTGIERLSAGAGYVVVAAALLALACLAVLAAATTAWRRPSSLTRSASGPRAPPAFAAC
jgi:hypothetical protein